MAKLLWYLILAGKYPLAKETPELLAGILTAHKGLAHQKTMHIICSHLLNIIGAVNPTFCNHYALLRNLIQQLKGIV